MVNLLHAMAFMVLLLVGWVIWNNKPLPLPFNKHRSTNPLVNWRSSTLFVDWSLLSTSLF